MRITYKTTVYQGESKNTTGIQVPPEVIEKLNAGKKPKVIVTLNGYTYRSTVAVMGGQFLISLSAENRNAAGVQGGDPIEVTLALDTEPRTVDIPTDLADALTQAGVMATFEALAFSKRKEFVRQVEDAKAPETRERRITSIITKLTA